MLSACIVAFKSIFASAILFLTFKSPFGTNITFNNCINISLISLYAKSLVGVVGLSSSYCSFIVPRYVSISFK